VNNADKIGEQEINESNEQYDLLKELKTPAPENVLSEEVINRNSELITVISKISSHFIGTRDIDRAINDALSDLGRVTFASRAYLFLLSDDGLKLSNTHEWCAHGVAPQINHLQNLPTDTFAWSMQKLEQKETIQITDVSKMPEHAKAEKQILEQQDIKSLLIFPVLIKDEFAGFIGFDNVEAKGSWSDSAVLLLRLFSEIIGSAFERAQIEQNLEIKEHAISSSVNGIAIADLEGNLTYINDSFLKMWRCNDEKEVIGKSVLEFWKSQDEADRVVGVLREKGYWVGELIAVREDSSTFDVQLSASMVKDDSGKPICMISSFVDVSEHKRAETALRESEEKFRRMFQDVTDAITVTDLKGVITDVNEKTLELHGYESKTDVLGKSAFELIAPCDHDEAAVNMQKTTKEGSIKSVEYTLVRRDGSEFPGELSASVLRDSFGNPIGYIAITRDITERKRVETELRKLATTDMLTDVYNRRSGLLLFKQQLQLAQRNKQILSICYVDIDFLKTVNDIYGHAEGDEVLKTTGAIMKEVLRKVDIVCRLGGDEFLLIFPQCTIKQAVYIWNRIDDKINSFNAKKTKPYSISLSRGFAECDPVNEKSADQLITIADKEMYKHKHTKFQKE
jgi:diguanylate cyclase (GGDEF)-like protein/PAS domain S-box-containing protein